jgi:hypothetical protein
MLSDRLSSFIPDMLKMCQAQFPRKCGTCGKVYPSFKIYVESVSPIGLPKIDDIEDEDPIGLMSFGNCACGSTLLIQCEHLGENAEEMHRIFNETLRQEEAVSGRSMNDILFELRAMMRVAAVDGR